MDLPTAIRLARLALDDLARSRNYNTKGKVTVCSPCSEEETAFRMQVEYIEHAIHSIEDAEFARSLDEGAETNHPSLGAVGDWQAADLRAALALLKGQETADGSARPPSSSGSPGPSTLNISQYTSSPSPSSIQRSSICVSTSSESLRPSSQTDLPDDDHESAVLPTSEVPPDISSTTHSSKKFLRGGVEESSLSNVSCEFLQGPSRATSSKRDALLSESSQKGKHVMRAYISASVRSFSTNLAESYSGKPEEDRSSSSSAAAEMVSEHEECMVTERPRNSRSLPDSVPISPAKTTAQPHKGHIFEVDHLPLFGSSQVYNFKGKLAEVCPYEECASCLDFFSASGKLRILHAPCGDKYCESCIIRFVDACTRDESVFPLRCCNRAIPFNSILPFLPSNLQVFLRSKRMELGIPATYRLYCSKSTCSAFLGSSEGAEGDITCYQCSTSICASCKQASHPGDSCSDNTAVLEVRALARTKKWQTCPGCSAIIELTQGCYHITCLCRAQFCYLCAALWKECGCPQWDEGYIVREVGVAVIVADDDGLVDVEEEVDRADDFFAQPRVQERDLVPDDDDDDDDSEVSEYDNRELLAAVDEELHRYIDEIGEQDDPTDDKSAPNDSDDDQGSVEGEIERFEEAIEEEDIEDDQEPSKSESESEEADEREDYHDVEESPNNSEDDDGQENDGEESDGEGEHGDVGVADYEEFLEALDLHKADDLEEEEDRGTLDDNPSDDESCRFEDVDEEGPGEDEVAYEEFDDQEHSSQGEEEHHSEDQFEDADEEPEDGDEEAEEEDLGEDEVAYDDQEYFAQDEEEHHLEEGGDIEAGLCYEEGPEIEDYCEEQDYHEEQLEDAKVQLYDGDGQDDYEAPDYEEPDVYDDYDDYNDYDDYGNFDYDG